MLLADKYRVNDNHRIEKGIGRRQTRRDGQKCYKEMVIEGTIIRM